LSKLFFNFPLLRGKVIATVQFGLIGGRNAETGLALLVAPPAKGGVSGLYTRSKKVSARTSFASLLVEEWKIPAFFGRTIAKQSVTNKNFSRITGGVRWKWRRRVDDSRPTKK
jgi:hypothetical protein